MVFKKNSQKHRAMTLDSNLNWNSIKNRQANKQAGKLTELKSDRKNIQAKRQKDRKIEIKNYRITYKQKARQTENLQQYKKT